MAEAETEAESRSLASLTDAVVQQAAGCRSARLFCAVKTPAALPIAVF